jgi:phosphopentomutase
MDANNSRESIEELKAKHQKEYEEVVEVHENLIDELEEEHNREIKKIEAKYNKVFNEVQEEHEHELKVLQYTMQEQINTIQAEREVQSLNIAIETLTKARTELIDRFLCKRCQKFVQPSTLRECIMGDCHNHVCHVCLKCRRCVLRGSGLKEENI